MSISEMIKAITTGNIKPLIIKNLPAVEDKIISSIEEMEQKTGERKAIIINLITINGQKKLIVTIGNPQKVENNLLINMETANKKTFNNFVESIINNYE
jgi:hypothetical protein